MNKEKSSLQTLHIPLISFIGAVVQAFPPGFGEEKVGL